MVDTALESKKSKKTNQWTDLKLCRSDSGAQFYTPPVCFVAVIGLKEFLLVVLDAHGNVCARGSWHVENTHSRYMM